MSASIRIVTLVDHSEVSASIERELGRTGLKLDFVHANGSSDLFSLLDDSVEVILADLNASGVSLDALLANLRQRELDIPVIVISSEEDDAVAVESVKQGAADFLHKDHLSRLASVIAKALELKRRRAEERRTQGMLRFLAEAGAVLSSSLDFEATLNSLATLVVPKMGDWCVITMVENGKIRHIATAHSNPQTAESFRQLTNRYPIDLKLDHNLAGVLANGQPVIIRDIPDEVLVASARDEEHLDALRGFGLKSSMVVPLAARDRILGTMSFIISDSPRSYDENDLHLAQELANRAALAVENSLLYREAKLARQTAESANQAKSQFLANMSHEIRTPLGAVLGFAELMLNPQQAPQDRRDCVLTILRNGRQLLSLIDDILDLSKVEAGKLEIDRAKFSLTDLVVDITQLLKAQADKKGLFLRVEADGPIPATITTDATRLRQVLINIIGNAIKFTERGGVTIKIRLYRDDPEFGNKLAFQVTDTGRGLNGEERARIFQPFVQANSVTKRQYGGTGLGLVLSRKLAHAMGGDVKLQESQPGAGSTFLVLIEPGPLDETEFVTNVLNERKVHESAHAPKDERGQLADLNLLLVDDAPDNRLLISKFLKLAGASVDLAVNGREGVASALSGNHDLVLMDIQMPEVDGYQAMQELRQKGYKKPIVALTAHAMKDEESKCRKAGCDGYLTKPVDRKALINKVSELCDQLKVKRSGAEATPMSPTDVANGDVLTTLVDDPVIQRIVSRFMRCAFPEHVATLGQAIASGNWHEVARIGHLLKGSVGAHNFPDLGVVAEQIEAEAKGLARPEVLRRYVSELESFKSIDN